MSVIEAMAAGLPVITTPVGGIPELIRDGEEGLLVEPGDVDALAAKIEYLAGSKTIRSMLGSNAQKKVSDELNFEKYIADLRNKLLEVFAAK
jgi:glycosyltransferase involved in cell wall biosynthesis